MNLRNVLTIAKREFGAYFNSAIAYIFIIVFLLLSASLFMTEFFLAARADMRSFFNSLPIILCAFLPAVTMRLWAEDRRGNTLELLLTFPVRTHELVVGKYLASLAFYLISLATTLSIPLMLMALGRPDPGSMIGSYIGAILLGSFFLAFGLFVSGLCRDQIVAFISTLIICLGFILVGTDFIAASIDGWFPGIALGSFLKNTFGLLPHFSGFAKGVLDLRDFLYFAVGTIIFLILNGFWLEGRSRPKAKAIFASATLISVGIFLVFNFLIYDVAMGRFDLTQQKIYTVSDTTKKLLRDLKVPVSVKFYVSPQNKMPTQLKTLEQEATDKLEEFRIVSKGKFDYKVFHMEAADVEQSQGKGTDDKKQSLEEQIQKKGIEPFRVQSIEADQMGVRLVYSAMTIAYKERPEEIIPQVIPTTVSELEYLLMSKIYKMTLDKTPHIAIMAPYEEKALDPQMASIMMQLTGGRMPEQYREDQYKYLPAALEYAGYKHSRIRLNKSEPIPEDVTTLLVIEPKNLNDRQSYEINRFLHEGGSVLMAVQNYIFDYKPVGRRGLQVQIMPENPSANPLLESWGAAVDESVLMDVQSEMISMSGGAQMGPFAVSIPVKTPLQIMIGQDGMSHDISITSNLSPIFYLWGSALRLDDAKLKELNLKEQTLLKSSPQSWLAPKTGGALTTADFEVPRGEKLKGNYPLAVMLSGQFPNNFASRKTLPLWPEDRTPEAGSETPNAEPNVKDLEAKATPSPELHPKPGKLILVGAATIFQEDLIGGGGGHLNFFMNSVDAITLGEDLTKIRSKQEINRRIRHVSAAENILWRFIVMFFVPLFAAAFGAFRFFMRKQAKQNYLRSIGSVSV